MYRREILSVARQSKVMILLALGYNLLLTQAVFSSPVDSGEI